MSAQIAAYGRLGSDPEKRTSQAGKEWARASIAVQLCEARDGEDDAPATWLSIVAFGRVAETLARHRKGDLVSVAGRLQLNRWTDREGQTREQLQVIADAIVSAKAVRPGGGRRDGGSDRP
ncbi:MAG: single-stranded DNA-binding protein [Sphingomonadales bacterium]|nr:single-stranded DNA-binding protein [Sphingomonadales bacterium]